MFYQTKFCPCGLFLVFAFFSIPKPKFNRLQRITWHLLKLMKLPFVFTHALYLQREPACWLPLSCQSRSSHHHCGNTKTQTTCRLVDIAPGSVRVSMAAFTKKDNTLLGPYLVPQGTFLISSVWSVVWKQKMQRCHSADAQWLQVCMFCKVRAWAYLYRSKGGDEGQHDVIPRAIGCRQQCSTPFTHTHFIIA